MASEITIQMRSLGESGCGIESMFTQDHIQKAQKWDGGTSVLDEEWRKARMILLRRFSVLRQ
jgi:hypothetical protein